MVESGSSPLLTSFLRKGGQIHGERQVDSWRVARGIDHIVTLLAGRGRAGEALLDAPDVRITLGSAVSNPVPVGSSGFHYVDAHRLLPYLGAAFFRAEPEARSTLIDRIILRSAITSEESPKAYYHLLGDIRAALKGNGFVPPNSLLASYTLGECLPATLSLYVRTHPLAQVLAPGFAPFLVNDSNIATWSDVPEELRAGVTAALLYDSPLLSNEARNELLEQPARRVREIVKLLLVSNKRGYTRTPAVQTVGELVQTTRRFLEQWLAGACGEFETEAEAPLRKLSNAELSTAVVHASRLKASWPELTPIFELLVNGKQSLPAGPGTVSGAFENFLAKHAEAIARWREPVVTQSSCRINPAGTSRVVLTDELLSSAASQDTNVSLARAQQQFRELMKKTVIVLDNEISRLTRQPGNRQLGT